MIKVPDNENCYPAIVGTSSDENANSKLENFNWGHLYLYSKVRQTQKEVNQSAIEESEENNEETVTVGSALEVRHVRQLDAHPRREEPLRREVLRVGAPLLRVPRRRTAHV